MESRRRSIEPAGEQFALRLREDDFRPSPLRQSQMVGDTDVAMKRQRGFERAFSQRLQPAPDVQFVNLSFLVERDFLQVVKQPGFG